MVPAGATDSGRSAAVQNVWFRTTGPVPDDSVVQQSMLAYMSDFSLLDTATHPHGVNFLHPRMQVASLDHAMWFHRSFRAQEWLLYALDSPSAGGARGVRAWQHLRPRRSHGRLGRAGGLDSNAPAFVPRPTESGEPVAALTGVIPS